VAGAHNSVSQSRLMDQELWIIPGNCYKIMIYDNQGEGSHVAMAPQVEGLFRCNVDQKVARKGHQYREVSRERKLYTSPNIIPSEHTWMDIF